uniref:Uncharacterized protein n=1 Tax=Mycena chlorophos TaxID=658473 RepID=A0ABQ0KUB9_MYCCL|nr:predicted protein [Mycena chlorophos]
MSTTDSFVALVTPPPPPVVLLLTHTDIAQSPLPSLLMHEDLEPFGKTIVGATLPPAPPRDTKHRVPGLNTAMLKPVPAHAATSAANKISADAPSAARAAAHVMSAALAAYAPSAATIADAMTAGATTADPKEPIGYPDGGPSRVTWEKFPGSTGWDDEFISKFRVRCEVFAC